MLNIKTSARYALNNYTRFHDSHLNPEQNLRDIPYFYVNLDDGTPFASHSEWDFGDATGRYLDALILCQRIAKSGDPAVKETITAYYEAIKKMISWRKDGLCHRPGGYEWITECVNTFDVRSAMLGLVTYYGFTGDKEALSLFEGMINGIRSIGVDLNGYFYMPYAYYTGQPIEQKPYDIDNCIADPCHYGGGVHIFPMMVYYGLTKSVSALELCGKMTRFIIERSGVFDGDDGSFYVSGYFAGEDGHFHSRMSTVLGILLYAVNIKDSKIMAWCRKIYDFAVTQGTSYGFFPEGLGKRPKNNLPEEYPDVAVHTEICGTVDMLHIAVLLSEHGIADYWDHAERYMNQLIKSQLTDISWVSQSTGETGENVGNDSCYKAAERYIGGFTGRVMANDLKNNGRYDTMGCCAAAGGRGLWVLWDYALKHNDTDNTLSLNFWTHVENDYADVSIEVREYAVLRTKILRNCFLRVRIPGFIEKEPEVYVNGNPVSVRIEGIYYLIGDLVAGDEILLQYQAGTVTREEMLCGRKITVDWVGNTVVDVRPRGEYIPLYNGV